MWAFQHQRVYDPTAEEIVHLSDIPNNSDQDLDFLGPWLPPKVVKGIADGDLDPFTKIPFQATCTESSPGSTYEVKEYAFANGRKRPELPVQKNVLTNYFCLASLEAKRKFRAPKVMPKHSVKLEASSPCSVFCDSDSPDSVEEGIAPNTSHAQDSALDSRNLDDKLPLKDSLEGAFSSKSNEHVESLSQSEDGHFALVATDGNTKTLTRKVIRKSFYFQHRLSTENEHTHQNEEAFIDKEEANAFHGETLVSKGASHHNTCQRSSIKKRKLIHSENMKQEETLTDKDVHKTSVNIEEGTHIPNLSNMSIEGKAELHFGSDVSHLKNYAGIAEKSMERFVSLMSSFRYTSSGSRASGLRAPLKDVQNTCPVRSPAVPIDFSKYAYTSNKLKKRV